MSRVRSGRRALLAMVAAAALILTAVLFYQVGSGRAPAASPPARPTPSPTRTPTTAEIYTAVAPSVVSIDAVRAGPTTTEAGGTGIVVNADGTIVTALHVVNGATALTVTFADGTASPATVAATAPALDIAALTPAQLPSLVVPAVLGNAGRLAVGDNVVAIGNQLGLTRTTTTGVVSGLDRRAVGSDGAQLTGLIQFDAAVNPGSSGGPLLDGRGETVGAWYRRGPAVPICSTSPTS